MPQRPHMEFSVELAQRPVRVEVHRNTRRRTRIGMNFTPQGVLRLDVPPGTRRAEIEATVRAHERWIAYRLSRAEAEPGYRSPGPGPGEAYHYLGRLYPLERLIGSGCPMIALVDGALIVMGATDDEGLTERLRDWYRERGREVFAERLGRLVAGLEWLNEVPSWRQRYMTSQWGSCSASGRLSLNTHLLKTPVALIDYVLLHELCHLAHLDHGPEFHALMAREMPDWKRRRVDLNRYTPMLRDPC